MTIEFMRLHFSDRSIESDPILFLLDDFSGNWTPDVRAYASQLNILLMKVPGGLTRLSQPADVAWMKPIKDRLRLFFRIQSLRHQLRAHESSRLEEPFRMNPPNRGNMIKWTCSAWDSLSSTTIVAGFKRCGYVYAIENDTELDDEALDC